MIFCRMLGRKWLVTTLLVLVGAGVCIRLGIWQLDRLEQRQAFNSHYLSARAMPPVELPVETIFAWESFEYRRVVASGTYDYNQQVALRNQYRFGEPGYHLLTPLVLKDGTAILVDRGWIPASGNDNPGVWPAGVPDVNETVTGTLRLGRSKPDLGGVPDPELLPGQERLDFWNMVNIERISLQISYPLLPVYIQPEPDPADETVPVALQPEIEITEGPHFGYAIQWFTFATILLIGYPFYLRKQT